MQEITLDTQCFITTSQVVDANRESIRLGFARTLELPPSPLPEFRFPVWKIWRHTSTDGNEYIRLSFFLAWLSDGSDGEQVMLDVTPDVLAIIRGQEISVDVEDDEDEDE